MLVNEEYMAVEYRMEIYINSFVNDPDVSLHAKSPFMAISVGDEMEPAGWPNSGYGRDKIAVVKALRHLLWEVDRSHLVHSLSVCVTIKEKDDWRRSSIS